MWQKQYKQNNFYWGLKPSPILKKFINKIPTGNALDIGCGEGRNSFYLASFGFKVIAIDEEKAGINKINKYIKQKNIKNIKTSLTDINSFNFKGRNATLILAIHSLDFLKLSNIKKVIGKIKKSVKSRGYIIISVFSTKEPAYHKIANILKREEIEENTFYLPKLKTFRHFFTKKEIEKFFKAENLEIVYLKQRQKEDFHGDSDRHFHNIIEMVIKKG